VVWLCPLRWFAVDAIEDGAAAFGVSREDFAAYMDLFYMDPFSKNAQPDCARFRRRLKISVDRLFTHRWQLPQADEAYRLFDQQNAGKGVFVMA
jgi:hypothetical protein